MDEKRISGHCAITSEEKIDTLYPMFFGVSCAFLALKLLAEPRICDDGGEKWAQVRNRMLKGSARLLGMLVWSVKKGGAKTGKCELLLRELESARKQVEELKKRRSEEARANEKVVSIIASREQTWVDERRRFRQHIEALVKELRVLEMKREKCVAEMNHKLKENESVLQSKDELIEEGEQKRREVEEKLEEMEKVVHDLRENTKVEGERHSNEIMKHKTAFIELVSNQRQLEAEMGRTLRQVEALKQELDSMSKQKEQSVLTTQRLSLEVIKTRKELDHKDQILSAMLRKAKLDAAEKQALLKDTKACKVMKRKQMGTVRWKASPEAKNERHSLRNMLSRQMNTKSDAFSSAKGLHSKVTMSLDAGDFRVTKGDHRRAYSFLSDAYSTEGSDEQRFAGEAERLENWIDANAETYDYAAEQRHNIEIDAFVEQLRLKDEKLEAIRWRLLSMELESKRLQSHIEGTDRKVTELRQENMKLENLLMDREAELHLLKEQLVLQFNPPNLQKLNFSSSIREAVMNRNPVWSKVKVVKRKNSQKRQETKPAPEGMSEPVENGKATDKVQFDEHKEMQEGKASAPAASGTCHIRQESIESDDGVHAETTTTSTSSGHGLSQKSSSTWKMDIHALGVSYKIKRLKQQFLMLERLAGKQESCENSNGSFGVKGFYALTSLLNKQVDRYQSLQGKTDDICQRMHDNNLNLNRGSAVARTEEETKKLEQFLEETFQLQRYIVATGQKLMEVQAKIASAFVNNTEDIEKPENFDMKRFADSIRTLFREVQRGLEIRISRIIGDLEGTLACDGIIHLKK